MKNESSFAERTSILPKKRMVNENEMSDVGTGPSKWMISLFYK